MAAQPIDWWEHERTALARGFTVVAGIDEAGRGPLAGPVVAAAVILPFERSLDGVRDSKVLSADQRATAFDLIHQTAVAIGVGIADCETIDRINIHRATHHAMREAVAALPVRPDHALIDGLPVQPFPVLQTALVKGDGRSASIAAASIVAKVTRDRMMVELHEAYPQYGFASHKGYASEEHLSLLKQHGPCPIHRRSFEPVARLLGLDAIRSGQLELALESQDRLVVGMTGESVTTAHLVRLGWKILCERYRCRGGEIDIIAEDGGIVAFVEVKTMKGRRSNPREAVDARKRRRLVTAADNWLAERERECVCRFDVAEVRLLPDGNATVELILDAFRPGE